jgi:hypothetical protein
MALAMGRVFRMLRGMDTIKILLGVTVALLLGALAISWKGFQREQEQAPPAELAEVQRQIDEIRIEQARLKLERDRVLLGETAATSTSTAAAAPLSGMAGQPLPSAPPLPLQEAPPAAAVAPVAEDPQPLPAAGQDDPRARAVAAAPVVGKITEWVENPEIGSFATFEVVLPASVEAGTILCVRRNSGILGRLKVGEISSEGAIANASSEFGAVKPVAGDELILEPAVE